MRNNFFVRSHTASVCAVFCEYVKMVSKELKGEEREKFNKNVVWTAPYMCACLLPLQAIKIHFAIIIISPSTFASCENC
jgi:hypothetical protein